MRGKNWPVTGSLGNLTDRFLLVAGKALVLRMAGWRETPLSRGSRPKNKVARIKSRSRADNAPPRFFMDEREPKTLAHVLTTCCRKMGNLRGALTFLLDIWYCL